MFLKVIDIETYSKKAEAHIGIFGSENWLSIYGSQLNIIGIYKDENQLIGGFYFLKVKKYGLTFAKLPPYTPHCGLFFVSETTNISSGNNFYKEIITEVCNYVSKEKAAVNILAFPKNITDMQPFIWNNFKVIPNYTYQIDLVKDIESIKNNFDSKNRNVINKVSKEDLTLEENTLSELELYNFFNKVLSKAKANIYAKELKNIFSRFSTTENSFSLISKKHGKVIGAVFCIYDNITCYYLLGGTVKYENINGVNNLLILKSLEKAQTLGCKVFDFEGSMLKGVEKFFRSFGGQLIPYYTINKAWLWLEILLKFKKRNIF
jgi:lipid II:glycine glycyltransferase (peptidoglycan interpeptide bridge formation enzyme)